MHILNIKKISFIIVIILFNMAFYNQGKMDLVAAAQPDPCAPYGCCLNGPCPLSKDLWKPDCCIYTLWSINCSWTIPAMHYEVGYPQSMQYCDYWD